MQHDDIVIAAARRTPIGALGGALSALSAPELGSAALAACLRDAGVPAEALSEVVLGCVLPAGQGQAPARQAALAAGIPEAVGCTTINKMCGSGMKAVMLAADSIRAGSAELVLAGGMESMSNAPYLLPGVRRGWRMGPRQALDHMLHDGLQSPFDGRPMGHFAEETAARYGYTREDQDRTALLSLQRARAALERGGFRAETAPVTAAGSEIAEDETPYKLDPARIPELKPVFRPDGTITAASSSGIADGAAAVLVTTRAGAERLALAPLARIVGHAAHAQAPEWFTTAPAAAVKKLLERIGWHAGEVDLYEINEAFACVSMAAMQELSLPPERVNVHGGACALGHPIGATGARILVTLTHSLIAHGLRRGVAALCIGGGEATAIAIERL